MTSFVHDLRYALRSLRRAPRFTAVVVLTLALGIGANTAIFSVVNRLLLHPLPYPHSDRLVYLALGSEFSPSGFPVTKRITLGWQQQARSLEGVEAYSTHDFLATTGDRTDVVLGLAVTPGLSTLLGVHPVIGRSFVPDDARPGAAPVVLISTALWRRTFAGSRDVVGRTITLDGTPRTVVGVIPQGADAIAGPSAERDIWLPLTLESADTAFSPTDFVNVVGRLRPGVTIAQVQHELDAITARMPKQTVFSGIEQTAVVTQPSQEFLSARTHDVLLVLLAAVAVVLLVACANVANILLARGTARAREIALRTALGASRWRLVRGLLVESILLAVAGGMLGLLFAWWGADLFARFGPDELRVAGGMPLDVRVLEFTLAISLVTGVLFGLMPTLRAASAQLGSTLRSSGSGVMRSGSGSRVRAVLVAGEMALSVLLLVSAGLLIRSVAYLQQIDPGFDVQHVFTVRVSLSRSGYQTVSSREQFGERMLSGLRRLPGVAVATEALGAPPGYTKGVEPHLGATGGAYALQSKTIVAFNNVQPDYFKALGIRMISGRTFTEQEMASGHVVIVNQTLAHRVWPRQPAIGQRLDLDVIGPSTVVGVAADIVTGGL
ncbi:MAG TPA: ADOP family duplicated permease, partial [Gemmatimonadaceae bacterium]|nr:ADOP family duplicated permease [Gemmatimonadaceae bacterium]